jgi:hypothetical protein
VIPCAKTNLKDVFMQYPIKYDYPAPTSSRTMLSFACMGLGAIGLWFNLPSFVMSVFSDNVGQVTLSICLLVFGAGIWWSIQNPQTIVLTDTHLHLPKTMFGGPARDVPYDDIVGVSLRLLQTGRGRVGTIFTFGRSFHFSTYMMGHAAFFDLVDQIHAHADLGPPPIGTLGGLFREGKETLAR